MDAEAAASSEWSHAVLALTMKTLELVCDQSLWMLKQG